MHAGFLLTDIPKSSTAVVKMHARKLPRTTFRFFNLGANDVVLQIQESDSANSGYANISGATQTIKPGGEADIDVVSQKSFLQVLGSGESYGKLDVIYRGAVLYGNVDFMVLGKTGFTTD